MTFGSTCTSTLLAREPRHNFLLALHFRLIISFPFDLPLFNLNEISFKEEFLKKERTQKFPFPMTFITHIAGLIFFLFKVSCYFAFD